MVWRAKPRKTGRRIVSSTWGDTLKLLKEETDRRLRAWIAVALFLVAAASALAALLPVLLKFIVDQLTESGPASGVYIAVGFIVAGYAGSHWLSRSLGELRGLVVGRADQRLHRRLSVRMFKHVMALPLSFHLDRKTGALSQTLANGLMGYRILLQHLVATVLPVIVEIAMMSTVLVVLGQPLFLAIITATLVCYAMAFAVGAARLTNPARTVSAAHIDATALLTDSILNYETIKSFCAEPRIHERMEDAFAKTESHWAQFFSRKALNGVLVGTIFAVSLGVSVYAAAKGVQRGRMSLGDFVLVNTYMLQIFRPMEMLGFAFRDIAQGMAFIEKLLEVLRQTPEPAAYSGGKDLPPGEGKLIFDKVNFSYRRDHPVLKDLSFSAPAGRAIAIVGASGSGKSSIVRLLVRFYEPDSGNILLDGMPVSEASAPSLREAIAVVPQDTVLFNDTIAYNISVGHGGASMDEIMDAARLAHIHDFIIERPDGYQTLVGERGLKLSGGEKQRIAIARAALRKPRIFVFDEATSSLDSKTEQQILRNLTEVSRGTTTLMIAHRLSTIMEADEILVLERGEIVERGSHRELLRHGGNYRAMWLAQQRNHRMQYEKVV